MPDFRIEATCPAPVAGVDEAGRGPLAGPVYAAAAILAPADLPHDVYDGLDDSKALDKEMRAALYDALYAAQAAGSAWLAIAHATVAEIDRLNILGATLLAMRRAVAALPRRPAYVLVDGNRPPDLPHPVETIVKGDGRCCSIAAASILAKVARDRTMAALAREHPAYGWDHNAGYATQAHRDALARLGPTPHHRAAYAPVVAARQAQLVF